MNSDIVLIAAIAVPVVLLLALRTHAAIVFLSLCAGSILLKYIGDDAVLSLSFLWSGEVAESVIRLGVLLIPVLLSAIFLRRSMSGPKFIVNILPAVVVGVVGALLAVPLLPNATQGNLTGSQAWQTLEQAQELIVGAGILVSLAGLWIAHRSTHDKGHHKGKHHK